MLARESTAALKPFRVVALGGKVSWIVLAAAKPSVVNDSSKGFAATQTKFSVGAESPVECTIMRRQLDPANFIRKLITVPAGAHGKVETVMDSVEHRGYFRVSILLRWGPDGSTVAAPKIAVVPMPDSTLVCSHDQPGYQKTFDRVVTSVVKTLEPYDNGPAPKYLEVQQATLGGVNFGGGIARVFARDDGTRQEVDRMAFLVFGGGEIHAKDLVVVDVTDKSGSLLSETAAIADDGKLATRLTATRTAPGEYVVEGTLDGKPAKTRLSAKHRVVTDATRARLLLSVAQGKAATATFDDLDASVSPAKIRTWSAKRLHGRTLLLSTGAVEEKCEVDASGLCSVNESTKGPASGLVARRVDAAGAP